MFTMHAAVWKCKLISLSFSCCRLLQSLEKHLFHPLLKVALVSVHLLQTQPSSHWVTMFHQPAIYMAIKLNFILIGFLITQHWRDANMVNDIVVMWAGEICPLNLPLVILTVFLLTNIRYSITLLI